MPSSLHCKIHYYLELKKFEGESYRFSISEQSRCQNDFNNFRNIQLRKKSLRIITVDRQIYQVILLLKIGLRNGNTDYFVETCDSPILRIFTCLKVPGSIYNKHFECNEQISVNKPIKHNV